MRNKYVSLMNAEANLNKALWHMMRVPSMPCIIDSLRQQMAKIELEKETLTHKLKED